MDYAEEEKLKEIWDKLEKKYIWLQYAEDLYIQENFIFRLIEDHEIERMYREMALEIGIEAKALEKLFKESKFQSIIQRLIEHLRSKYQKNKDDVEKLDNPFLIAFKNGYIDIKKLKETGNLELKKFDNNIENNPIFYTNTT